MRPTTLVFPIDEHNRILLGCKKRGFGQGKYNGFGGKIEPGETFRQCAVRELYEESGLLANPQDLECVALFDFQFPIDETLTHISYTYVVRTFTGDVKETDEMESRWILIDEIPYEHMWSGDREWIPQLLKGDKLVGIIAFDRDNSGVDLMKLNIVDEVMESELVARIDAYIEENTEDL